MKKLCGILVIFILIATGCGKQTVENDPCKDATPEITMVTDKGGINDKSFNQGTWEGIKNYCREEGRGAVYIESKEDSQYITNLTAAAEKSKVVVASGFLFEKPLAVVAQKFPDVNFILIDGSPKDENDQDLELDNVVSYFFEEKEAGYIAGYIASKESKTGKIGFIGGMQIPPVENFGIGYVKGAEAANPNVEVEYIYTGDFNKPEAGKTVADAMLSKGVDMIFTVAGGTNSGAVQASINDNKAGKKNWIIGVDIDMYNSGLYKDKDGNEKSVVLTSAIKGIGDAAFNGIKATFEGTFKSGINVLGLKDQGVGIPKNNPNLVGKEALIQEAEASLLNTLATTGINK